MAQKIELMVRLHDNNIPENGKDFENFHLQMTALPITRTCKMTKNTVLCTVYQASSW